MRPRPLHSGGQGGGGAHRQGQIPGEADDRVAHSSQEHYAEERHPEAGAAEHFCGGVIPGLKGLAAGGFGGFGGGEDHIGGGTAEDQTDQDQHHAQSHAQNGIGGAPANGGIFNEAARQIAQNQRTGAEAHKQSAGAQTLFVGKPGADRGQNDIVGGADAEAGQDAVSQVQKNNAASAEGGGENKAAAGHDACYDDGDLIAQTLGHDAAGQSAQTEEAHGEGEVQSQTGSSPAKLTGKRRLQNRPGVNDAGKEHGDDAHHKIEPANGKLLSGTLHENNSFLQTERSGPESPARSD